MKLNEHGYEKVSRYIKECTAKRKEILDAGIDTASETEIPTVEDILSDAEAFGFDDDGDYVNSWGVTDNYNADEPISLNLREDFEKM